MSDDIPNLPPEGGVPVKSRGGAGVLLPLLLVVILMPLLSYAMTEFVLIPRIKESIPPDALAQRKEAPASTQAPAKRPATHSVRFDNIISNLSGAGRNRYIKVSFTVYSANPRLTELVETNRSRMMDTALSVLSNLSMADIERPGIQNLVRGELLIGFEQVFRERMIEELYFSEFVIQ